MVGIKNFFAGMSDLQKRILFTLFALITYRIGSFIPLPGVNASAVLHLFDNTGMMGMFDMFSGGSMSRMSVLALNILPYISASIVIQLMSTASQSLAELRKEGESGRMKLNQYTRYLAIVLCIVQGWTIARWLMTMAPVNGIAAVANPGAGFMVSTIVALVGGTAFVMWLAEQITARGIGNGPSLLIFAGIIAEAPGGLSKLIALGNAGAASPFMMFLIVGFLLGMIALIAFVEQAQRRIQILYPRGNAMSSMQNKSYLPVKINMSGVMGPVFASAIMTLPAFVARFVQSDAAWFQEVMKFLTYGNWSYMALYAVLIVFFSFFQTAIVFNSEETSEQLKNAGGYIPGVRPGAQTQAYLDGIVSRTTAIGCVYLVAVCCLPIILNTKFGMPLVVGGTSILIIAGVVLDTFAQIQSHIITRQYSSIIKKAGKKSRFRV